MKRYLGIELGSTRIKAVVIDENHIPVSMGDYVWKSSFENGVWTYDLGEAISGLKIALSQLKDRGSISRMGISGMMHGYLAFDKDWNLLTPFRTWQNTVTGEAAEILSNAFEFNIPQRWSIAHLYQAVLNGEEHVNKIAHITTLAGYIHYMLTGTNAVGIGEASGMFPIDSQALSYNEKMLCKFENMLDGLNLPWNIRDILPRILLAGDNAGALTESGAKMLDDLLSVGTAFAPAEGDAGTGMTATNAVAVRSGNVSAGTSIFSMVVLEKPLNKVHKEIDIVTTPSGKPVAMVHCNNCTNDTNAWVSVFKEYSELFGEKYSDGEIYTKLYQASLKGDADCGGILVCNYIAGEGVTHFDSGRPLVIRRADSKFTLANFMRASLYSTIATLKIGMDILASEGVTIDRLMGHGGLFKTSGVGQKYLAAACNASVTCMQTAGEGGPYGMALLASYADRREDNESLEDYLNNKVFADAESITLSPEAEDVDGFSAYMNSYMSLLEVERKATEVI